MSGFQLKGASATVRVVKIHLATKAPFSCLRLRASRRRGLTHDQGLGTVQRPARNAVPAKGLEALELVNDRTANRVELLRNGLSKSLLAGEVGVEHAGLGATGTGTG